MHVYRSFEAASACGELRHLAMGFFDGLHRGHERVILGAGSGLGPAQTGVLTFDPHPQAVLQPDRAPELLTGLPHKLKILESWKLAAVLVLPFTQERVRQEAEAFLEELGRHLGSLQEIAVGPNFRFGHRRLGDLNLLSSWCARHGIDLRVAAAESQGADLISSSRIRDRLRAGDLEAVEGMLGRRLTYLGTVVKGRQLGAQLGFPTLNLATEDACFPPFGVYAGWVVEDPYTAKARRYEAVFNLGIRPTVEPSGTRPLLEGHLLGASGDWYGREVAFELGAFVRGERRFDSLDALKRRIAEDADEALQWHRLR